MEFQPTFDDTPEPRRRRRRSRSSTPDEDQREQQPVENEDEEESSPGGQEYELDGPAWHGWLFASVPMLVILLGAGREAWSKGLAALLLGALMIAFPMRRRLPRIPLLGLLAVALAPGLAFLPKAFQGVAAWRETLEQSQGLALPSTVTPQPWVTLEAWLQLALCAAWLGWALGRGFSSDQRRTMLRVLAGGSVLVCVLTILEARGVVRVPWWPRNPLEWGEGFGPFANRNHISSLAAMACVLCAAAAYDAHRRKERSWMLFSAGFFPPVAAIFMNSSRAGLLLLFFGMTLWLGTSAMRKGFFKKMAVSASLIFMAAAVMFIADSGLAARLEQQGYQQALSSGARVALYRDTLVLLGSAPWLGIGLGNFDTVFALATRVQDPRSRALHPESDLLWFMIEGGLITLVPMLMVLLWILRSTGPWSGRKSKGRSHRQDRRLRNTAAIILCLGLVHGLIDVPVHGLGYASLMALLAGIALRPRRLPRPGGTAEKLGSLAVGTAALALGVTWLMVGFGRPVMPGTSSAAMLRAKARELAATGSLADALPLLDAAMAMRPLDYALHFERAQTRLRLGHAHDEVLQDFTRARALEPHFAYMCYNEGVDWLPYRPEYAILGWREFLKRLPEAGPGLHGYFRQMLQHAQSFPDLRQQLWSLASTSLDLKLEYLATIQTREDFEFCLRDILTRQPSLAALDPSQRMTLFQMWERLGDREALFAAIESNKQWQKDGAWRLLAEHYAQKSDFKRACELAVIYLPSLLRTAPGASVDVAALERAFLFNVMDARVGVELFQAYKARGEIDRAISTLEKVKNAANAPGYIPQELAALHVLKEDYRRAWECYREAAQQQPVP
ncbi:MAG: O-antigen ligase family protein [Verrucomicrobiaceae bacterium]|nr:O-antigen ligase family protein [Verrucomicrobiaceae bacterium]